MNDYEITCVDVWSVDDVVNLNGIITLIQYDEIKNDVSNQKHTGIQQKNTGPCINAVRKTV